MKKTLLKKLLLAAALLVGGVCAAEAQAPEGEVFLRLDGTELYLSADAKNAGQEYSFEKVNLTDKAQVFSFEAVDGGYYVKCGGYTMVRDTKNGWVLSNQTDASGAGNNAVFTVESEGNGIKLKCVGRGDSKYVGCDSRNEGSHIYSDKDGDKVCVFVPVQPAEIYPGVLLNNIAEAQTLLDTTEEGTDNGQYPAEARRALAAAIAEATALKDSADMEAVVAGIKAIQEAMDSYKSQVVAPEFVEGIYKFHHDASGTGNLLASGWHANSWESGNTVNTGLFLPEASLGGYNAEFTVKKSPDTSARAAAGQTYNILDKNGNRMVNANGDLRVNSDTDVRDDNAKFTIEQLGDNKVRIKSVATGKNIGPNDNTKGWSWIHAGTNHTGVDNGDVFTAELLEKINTGVGSVAADVEMTVSVAGGVLTVEGTSADVYTLAGAKVATVAEGASVELTSGIYVLAGSNGKTMKVIVR